MGLKSSCNCEWTQLLNQQKYWALYSMQRGDNYWYQLDDWRGNRRT